MSSTETKKITSMFVLEVIGRPQEFLIQTLNDLVKKIGEEKGVCVKDVKINPPILMKDQKDFFTSFAEIELETDNMLYLAILMFKYMPAYIEIISPQNLSLTNSDLNDVLNELARRLHGYEEIVRMVQAEKIILERRLREEIASHSENKIKVNEVKKENPQKKKRKNE
jgi:hypothetical protein